MQTKDPNLTKTRINEDGTHVEDEHGFNENENITATMQESVIGSGYLEEHPALQPDDEVAGQTEGHIQAHARDTHPQTPRSDVNRVDHNKGRREEVRHDKAGHDKIEKNTTVNKGTDTFTEDVVETEHVNDNDNPARQPDRRDQEGSSPFDDNVNEETVGSEAPKSDEITDSNRYASVDNAQSRILTPDEKGDESINPRGMGE